MAGELVGGAFLSAFLQSLFDRMASREVIDFFNCRRLNDQLLKKLDATLNSVNGLLDDAEEKQITVEAGIGEKPVSRKIPSTSLVIESDVYGRSNDREAIIEVLLSHSRDLGVISIVGMGGIEEFDVLKLTKVILEEVTGQALDTKTPISSLNQLQLELKRKLEIKKFLLVLDDVWSDKQADWEILEAPLKFGGEGSKIVVTTRNEQVALAVNSVATYHLTELSVDECGSLFKRRAFHDENSSLHPDLEQIGREIVRKYKGLPFAVKTLGTLLRNKRDVSEWKMILMSNLRNLSNDNIFSAIKLSYYYLPSYLKRCFA
ncbi:hypothetical protein GH714_033927 [Hevea brasiliensis]|uniref:NB-ARC domain-containing protein n=1 Tax=Hevea brasiliensis TaxID=3981 RepID=A0A6A6L6T1_HEVBR|nr:hypothetical protein GH714_033927 [Hevea brasiliensis]